MRLLQSGVLACVLHALLMLPVSAVSFDLEVLPAEHQMRTDPQTGAELTFLTTHPAEDGNLYYEQRSWLADSSLILFYSSRENGGLMGYLVKTGELVRLMTPSGGLGGATAARSRNSVFGVRGNDIVELALTLSASDAPIQTPSRVTAEERVLATLGPNYQPANTSLTEGADGRYLAVGAGARTGPDTSHSSYVLLIDVEKGGVRELASMPGSEYDGHVMFSLTNPNLVSYKPIYDAYLKVLDIRTGDTVWQQRRPDNPEFATHHCWWVNDTITYCGGFHPQPTEDADVKVVDIYIGVVRIAGRGNWWPEATSAELAKANWWHACGHESGKWIAADNWHGDIGLFHGVSTRTYWLTRGHRTYGGGRHPEVGWDRLGKQVVFASHLLGNVDVCVATIPQAWLDEWEQQAQFTRN